MSAPGPHRVLSSAARCVTALSRVCGVASALMIAVSVVVVCHAVVARYVFNASSIWQTEFVTYLLIAATFIGSPYVMLTQGHVRVAFLRPRLGARARRVLSVFSNAFSMLACGVLAVVTIQLAAEAWENGWRSESLWGSRLWIPYGAMALGMTVLALQLAVATAEAASDGGGVVPGEDRKPSTGGGTPR